MWKTQNIEEITLIKQLPNCQSSKKLKNHFSPQIQCFLGKASDTAGYGEHKCSDTYASMNWNHCRAELVSRVFAAQQNEEAVNKREYSSNALHVIVKFELKPEESDDELHSKEAHGD